MTPALATPNGVNEAWTDDETWALLGEWGGRQVRLRAGDTLHGSDWAAIASAVNACRASTGRPPRSVSQCQKRIGTLKQKYKSIISSPSPSNSNWPFLSCLRSLVDRNPNPHHPAPPHIVKERQDEEEADEESEDDDERENWRMQKRQRRRLEYEASPPADSAGDAFADLAAAIEKAAEAYERVEMAKLRAAAEMERWKMDAMRDIEFERMRMLVECIAPPATARANSDDD